MSSSKRFFTKTNQSRSYVATHNDTGSVNGSKWIPNIETKYEFFTVSEFIDVFTPTKLSEGLKKAIEKAYETCGNVTFNTGNGNETFYFTK